MPELRDQVEDTVRAWDAHERARGARAIIDYDFAPPLEPVAPVASRLDVLEQLTQLLDRAHSDGANQIAMVITAYVAYLRCVLGERPALAEYIEATQGCSAAGWPAEYVTAVGKRALEAIAAQGVGWGPRTADELSEIEKRIDVRDAEERVRQVAAEYEPALRELVGTDAPYELAIEIHDVDDYWAYWVDGAGPRVRLRFNVRRATFTEVRLKHFVQHEILGHGLQCATYAQYAAQGVDWVRLSSVILPYQVMLEGLAQTMPLFVSPDDSALVTRVRIEHYEQLVRAELHQAINAGTPVEECAAHARGRIPWWTKNDIANELADRGTDPFLRSYLWAYPAGIDWFNALAETADRATATDVLRQAFNRPLAPQELAQLWPSGPLVGERSTSRVQRS